MNRTILAIAMAASSAIANAAPVSVSGVFNMYSQAGLDTSGVVPGGLLVGTDNTVFGFFDQAAGTWGMSSTVPFLGYLWSTSGGTLIQTPGSYSLNTTTNAVIAVGSCVVANDGNICFTIGANQIGGTIDFAWDNYTGMRVVEVWNINPNGNLTAAVAPAMENGALPGFNVAFNLNLPILVPVPVPAAVWLLGSGLLGLAGVARRRRGVPRS